MRVIIAGGSGLIGGALADELSAKGYEVIVLSRSPARVTGLPGGARVEAWDAQTAQGWGALVEGARAIVNLAGASIAGEGRLPARWTDERKRAIQESRVNAGEAVVEAVEAAAVRPAVVVQASAVGYYGTHGAAELDEGAPAGGDFLARTCVAWEAATGPVEAAGVRHVVARIGLALSTRGGVLPRIMLPFRYYLGGPLGSGAQWYSWIHINDLSAALRFLIEHDGASGAFNLTAPNPATNKTFSRELGRAMRRPARIPLPGFVLKRLLGEVAVTALEGQRATPKRLLDHGYAFEHPALRPALEHLLARGV